MIEAVGVVVPAHNEEADLPRSQDALRASAEHLSDVPVCVCVVADACSDQTARCAAGGVVQEVVTFPADVDLSNAFAMATELIAAFRAGAAVVIADMTVTERCGSPCIRYLIVANEIAAEAGAELRVVVRSPAVRRAMRTRGADQVLPVYGSMSDALSNARESAGQQARPKSVPIPALPPRAEMGG